MTQTGFLQGQHWFHIPVLYTVNLLNSQNSLFISQCTLVTHLIKYTHCKQLKKLETVAYMTKLCFEQVFQTYSRLFHLTLNVCISWQTNELSTLLTCMSTLTNLPFFWFLDGGWWYLHLQSIQCCRPDRQDIQADSLWWEYSYSDLKVALCLQKVVAGIYQIINQM